MDNNKKQKLDEIHIVDNCIKSITFDHIGISDKIIYRMNKWENVPKISLITGKNEVGKSHLLDFIQTNIKMNHTNIKIMKLDYPTGSENDFKSFIDNNSRQIQNIQNESHYLTEKSVKYLKDEIEFSELHYFSNQKHGEEYKAKIDKLRNSDIKTQEKGIKDAIKILEMKSGDKNQIRLYRLINNLNSTKQTINDRIKRFGQNNYQDDYKRAKKFYFENYPNPNLEEFLQLYSEDNAKTLIRKLEESELFSFNENLFKEFKKYNYRFNIDDKGQHSLEKIIGLDYKKLTSLSTAEFFILNLLSLKYEFNEMELQVPHIVLFDEPDKSLDPDYIRLFFDIIYYNFFKTNNIQVIITTHHSDTIDIANQRGFNNNDIGIYSIQRKNPSIECKIEKCHPLLATFRRTFGREITNIKVKVYTESLNDEIFYKAYYNCLSKYCQESRDKKQKKLWNHKLISRRYQLEFFPCAMEKNSGGGCVPVQKSVKRDCNAIDRIKNVPNTDVIPAELKKPFGIIDLDLRNDQVITEAGLKDRITVLKRYAIENYIFDPVLLFFNQTNLKEIFDEIVRDSDFKKNCLNILENLEYDMSIFNEYFKSILRKMLLNIENVRLIYNMLCLKVENKKKIDYFTIDSLNNLDLTKKKDLKNFAQIDELLKNEFEFADKITDLNRLDLLLQLTIPVNYHVINEPDPITFYYPKIFYYFRGHSIEEANIDMINTRLINFRKIYVLKAIHNNNPIIKDTISEYLNFSGGRYLNHKTLLCDMREQIAVI